MIAQQTPLFLDILLPNGVEGQCVPIEGSTLAPEWNGYQVLSNMVGLQSVVSSTDLNAFNTFLAGRDSFYNKNFRLVIFLY